METNSGIIQSFRKRITNTQTFLQMNFVNRNRTLCRQNVISLLNGFKIVDEIGFDEFEKKFQYNETNKNIIKDLWQG